MPSQATIAILGGVAAIVSTVLDPDGRRVALTEEGWSHIKRRHRRLARHLREVMAAVIEPERRVSGSQPGEEWYYRHGPLPGEWLRVVVHYDDDGGLIVTAFSRRSFP